MSKKSLHMPLWDWPLFAVSLLLFSARLHGVHGENQLHVCFVIIFTEKERDMLPI